MVPPAWLNRLAIPISPLGWHIPRPNQYQWFWLTGNLRMCRSGNPYRLMDLLKLCVFLGNLMWTWIVMGMKLGLHFSGRQWLTLMHPYKKSMHNQMTHTIAKGPRKHLVILPLVPIQTVAPRLFTFIWNSRISHSIWTLWKTPLHKKQKPRFLDIIYITTRKFYCYIIRTSDLGII